MMNFITKPIVKAALGLAAALSITSCVLPPGGGSPYGGPGYGSYGSSSGAAYARSNGYAYGRNRNDARRQEAYNAGYNEAISDRRHHTRYHIDGDYRFPKHRDAYRAGYDQGWRSNRY